MKKILSIILALTLVLGVSTIAASAAAPSVDPSVAADYKLEVVNLDDRATVLTVAATLEVGMTLEAVIKDGDNPTAWAVVFVKQKTSTQCKIKTSHKR